MIGHHEEEEPRTPTEGSLQNETEARQALDINAKASYRSNKIRTRQYKISRSSL